MTTNEEQKEKSNNPTQEVQQIQLGDAIGDNELLDSLKNTIFQTTSEDFAKRKDSWDAIELLNLILKDPVLWACSKAKNVFQNGIKRFTNVETNRILANAKAEEIKSVAAINNAKAESIKTDNKIREKKDGRKDKLFNEMLNRGIISAVDLDEDGMINVAFVKESNPENDDPK